MGLRKSLVKKGNPNVYKSGLFGIIDKAESANQMRNSKAGCLFAWNSKARKLTRNAMLEAEYRKAQIILLNVARQVR